MPRAKNTNGSDTKTSPADNIQYVAPVTEFPFVYANNAAMSVNELDGSITFGEIVGKEGEKLIVVPKVKVVMAAAFIPRLRDLLIRQTESTSSARK